MKQRLMQQNANYILNIKIKRIKALTTIQVILNAKCFIIYNNQAKLSSSVDKTRIIKKLPFIFCNTYILKSTAVQKL